SLWAICLDVRSDAVRRRTALRPHRRLVRNGLKTALSGGCSTGNRSRRPSRLPMFESPRRMAACSSATRACLPPAPTASRRGWSVRRRLAAHRCRPQVLTRSPGHYRDWIRACKGGEPACSNFNVAAPFVEWMVLGVIALRVEGKLEWDAAKMRFTNNSEANKY